MTTLFDPINIGNLSAKNRVFLAPMSRLRASEGSIPNDLMAEYYSQRGQYFGYVITEASAINPTCNCSPNSGGIYNEAQVDGWKKVVDKVHEKGGLIALQLYHGGRAGTRQLFGADPLGPSPIAANGKEIITQQKFEVPKELTKEQIQQIVTDFHNAAVLAKKAGFDGVQIQGGNGYLVDQFLCDSSNIRTDEYGGSIENRCKFLFEVVEVVIQAFGANKVSIRLSPTERFNDMYDSNPLAIIQYILPILDTKGLAFIEVKRNSPFDSSKDILGRIPPELQIRDLFKTAKSLLKNTPYVANQSITIEEAKELVGNGIADAISFGTLGISNPDLPLRIQHNYEINRDVDFTTWFTVGTKGYTDYPIYSQKLQQ